MVRVQAGAFVLVIVVERELLAGGVGQAEHGIQRRIRAGAPQLPRRFRSPAAPSKRKTSTSSGLIDAAVDDDGQRDRLGVGRRVVRFFLETFRQRVHGKRHAVGSPVPCCGPTTDRCPARCPCMSNASLVDRQIPAANRDGGLRAGRAAQRKDAGHKRQFADGDAINEILAATVQRVLGFRARTRRPWRFGSRAPGRDETVVVGIVQFLALGVVQRHRGLEPAGHGVGQIRNQRPRAGRDDQLLALARREPVLVHTALQDLAVQHSPAV